MSTSKHYREDRIKREKIIRMIGAGKTIASFNIDNHHPAGAEIHIITSTGIIEIYNERTGKLVTKLIARPNQLKKYFKHPDKDLMQMAYNHMKLGYNMI